MLAALDGDERVVCEVEDRLAGAEVLREGFVDQIAAILVVVGGGDVGDVGAPPLVDRLVVAHHEQLVVRDERSDEIELEAVAVL